MVNFKRFEFSFIKFVAANKWSSETSKMKGNNEEAGFINKYLKLIKFQILDAKNKLLIKIVLIIADCLREELFVINTTKIMFISSIEII